MFYQRIDNYCFLHGIKRLDTISSKQKSYRWLCIRHNKIFITNFKNLSTRHSRCSLCRAEKIKSTFVHIDKSYTIDTCNEIAYKKNCKCLSDKYNNILTPMQWQCNKCNHIWETTFQNILCSVHACSKCRISNTTENKVRLIFEEIFGYKFPSVRPDFLRNPDTGRNLELDGYCKELGIAFEYDGRMNYEEFLLLKSSDKQKRRHGDLTIRRKHDALKNMLCKKAGVKLFRIPYWVNTKNDYHIKFLLNKYIKS